MFIKKSLLGRLLLWAPYLAIIVYSISKLHDLSTNDALLRSLFRPARLQPSEQGNASVPALEFIPRIIHQTYKSENIPDAWRVSYNTCLIHNPEGDWAHILWTDATARDFVQEFYPSFLPTYDGYPYNIQRVDSFRYFVLYHYGGIYLDLDVGCMRDLSPLLTHHAFFAKTEPLGVSNDVMGVERGHPVFGNLVASLKKNSYRRGTKYPTVMMSTGPMFVTKLVLDFLKTRDQDKEVGSHKAQAHESLVTILSPALYGSSPDSYFKHYPGSTWHSWDAQIIVTMNSSPILCSLGVLLTCLACIQCRRRMRRRSCAAVAAKARGIDAQSLYRIAVLNPFCISL